MVLQTTTTLCLICVILLLLYNTSYRYQLGLIHINLRSIESGFSTTVLSMYVTFFSSGKFMMNFIFANTVSVKLQNYHYSQTPNILIPLFLVITKLTKVIYWRKLSNKPQTKINIAVKYDAVLFWDSFVRSIFSHHKSTKVVD